MLCTRRCFTSGYLPLEAFASPTFFCGMDERGRQRQRHRPRAKRTLATEVSHTQISSGRSAQDRWADGGNTDSRVPYPGDNSLLALHITVS